MVKYVKIEDAARLYPGYKNKPNIDKTGSLIGMRNLYGWNLKNVIQVGSYYYLIK